MTNPRSTASIAGHPIHPMLVAFPIAFFVATLACDITFWRIGDAYWATTGQLVLSAGLVMAALALPFAYLHARSGGISLKVFGGIMLGISFVLLNNVASHVGLLQNWTPWVAAATPSVLYLLLSLLAFQWLVRYR